MAIPATGYRSGTPALSSASVEAHTEPIDVEPLEPRASDTWRIAYGNSSRVGRIGTPSGRVAEARRHRDEAGRDAGPLVEVLGVAVAGQGVALQHVAPARRALRQRGVEQCITETELPGAGRDVDLVDHGDVAVHVEHEVADDRLAPAPVS